MRRTGVRSWTFVAVASIIGITLTACGGGGTSSDPPSSTSSQGPTTAAAAVAPQGAGAASNPTSSPSGSNAPGTVALSWLPPTEYTDGTAIGNLAGYDIYYGTQSENYTGMIKVSNPGVANYVVQGLSPGKYYFAVSAYDSTGAESDYSPEVSVTVN